MLITSFYEKMHKIKSLAFVTAIFLLGYNYALGQNSNTASLSGVIQNVDGSPLCAMVIANGQHQFSCREDGTFSLSNVSYDANSRITLFVFCEGSAPYKAILSEDFKNLNITLAQDSNNKSPSVIIKTIRQSSYPSGWFDISGTIKNDYGEPLSTLVVANGQYQFTNNPIGEFKFSAPPDDSNLITLYSFCDGLSPNKKIINIETLPMLKITKWHNKHSSALSITYDWGPDNTELDAKIRKEILSRELTLSYQLVTSQLSGNNINFIKNTLIPLGFEFFGHGQTHVNHDELTYEEALASFKGNYNDMVEIGLKPVSYAYPYGFGYRKLTAKALENSGFLSGRMFCARCYYEDPYIMPNDEVEPKDWFRLPGLSMMAYEYSHNDYAVNNADELAEYLDKAVDNTSWLILTYHSIGDTRGYGYYYLPEFIKDLDAIAQRDIWVASMNDVTLYARERKNAKLDFAILLENELQLSIEDNLDDNIFDFPLTVAITLPQNTAYTFAEFEQYDGLTEEIPVENATVLVNVIPNGEPYKVRLY